MVNFWNSLFRLEVVVKNINDNSVTIKEESPTSGKKDEDKGSSTSAKENPATKQTSKLPKGNTNQVDETHEEGIEEGLSNQEQPKTNQMNKNKNAAPLDFLSSQSWVLDLYFDVLFVSVLAMSNFAMGTIMFIAWVPKAQVLWTVCTSACGKPFPMIVPMAKLHSLLVMCSKNSTLKCLRKKTCQIALCNLLWVNDAFDFIYP